MQKKFNCVSISISALPQFSQNEKQVPILFKSSKGQKNSGQYNLLYIFSTIAQKEEEEKRTVAMVLKLHKKKM